MPNVLAQEGGLGRNVISTGNPEVDKKMGGGIPVKSLTIIEGQSDAGRSVLSQQMIWGSLNDKRKALLYTTENTMKSFVRQMASLSLDVSDHLLLGSLKIYPIQVAKAGWEASRVFETLLRQIRRDEESELVVVDSITGFVSHSAEQDTIAFFEECKGLCEQGRSIIAIAHSYAFNDATLIRIRAMCDAHLRLRIEELGGQ